MKPTPYDASSSSSGDRLNGGAECSFRMRLFGPFEAAIGGERIPRWRSRKTPLLLALLALRQGREVERSWLAGTLWPDSPEEAAYVNLRVELNGLRAALGAEARRLQTPTRRTLRLDLGGADVDVATFDQAILRGDTRSLELAASLCRGPLLDGCLEEWAIQERESRELALVRALESLAKSASASGDLDAAIRRLRQVLAIDPIRESAVRSFMQSLADRGRHGEVVEAYRNLRIRLRSALNTEPDPETTALFQRVRQKAQRSARAIERRSASKKDCDSNIPFPITALIGRESIVREIEGRVGSHRLVTLTGSGGVGKTRLAIQVAQDLADVYADGACYVELAGLSDSTWVPQAVASALKIREEPGRAISDTLAESLRSADLVLVLDNCEHLLDTCAVLADKLLKACAGLRILATSRQPLGITGEVTYRVPSLNLPDARIQATAQAVGQIDSVRLFLERATEAESNFVLTDKNAAHVCRICRQLDGIPLAIELAATQLRMLSAEELATRLGDCFAILTGGSRTALPRHQTLQAMIDWSYDLLSDREQLLLQRLSVFAGGWTLAAAEAVGAADRIAGADVVPLLGSLVEKSLGVCIATDGRVRYRLLETVRQYASERLAEANGAEGARNRHQSYFLALAETAAPHFMDGSQLEWLDRLDPDIDNFRAALAHVFDPSEKGEAPKRPLAENEWASRAQRMCAALSKYWAFRGHLEEGRQYCERALALPGEVEPAVQASALLGLNVIANWQADWEAAQRASSSGLEIARMLGDPEMLALFLFLRGVSFQRPDEQANALPYAEESVLHARRSGVSWALGQALHGLGHYYIRAGDHDKAAPHLRESVNILRSCGDRVAAGYSMSCLVSCAVERGDLAEAEKICREALTLLGPRTDRRCAGYFVHDMGVIAAERCQWARAVTILSAAESIHTRIGDRKVLQDELFLNSTYRQQAARTALGEAAYEAARAEGWQMTLEEAIDLALSTNPSDLHAD